MSKNGGLRQLCDYPFASTSRARYEQLREGRFCGRIASDVCHPLIDV